MDTMNLSRGAAANDATYARASWATRLAGLIVNFGRRSVSL